MLFDYVTYQVIWWALIGAVLILYGWTSGFDLGIGALLPFLARTNTERRVLINVIGPTWDGNQVWLIFAGGALFAVWPAVYAITFSGFYVALLLALWTLFLRPVGFEYRAKIHNRTWQSTWDWALFIGSVVPPIIIGVAFGNLLEGVPIHFNTNFRGFYDGSFWGLLNPFAVLAGIVALSMFITHGANILAMRTDAVIQRRCRLAARFASILYIISFAACGIWVATAMPGYVLVHLPAQPQAQLWQTVVHKVPGALLHNYGRYPWMLIAPVLGLAGALLALVKCSRLATVGSMSMIAGAILTFGFSLFPFIVPSSTHPNQSLTVWNAASSIYSLAALFWVAIIFLPLILFYTQWVYRKMWHTVTTDTIEKQTHELY